MEKEVKSTSFIDAIEYRGETPPSPYVISCGDRWKERVPEGCWELWESIPVIPKIIHMIKFDKDKEVLKNWFELNGDTENCAYFLHKGNSWFKLSPLDDKFDF